MIYSIVHVKLYHWCEHVLNKVEFELVHQLHVCEDAECPRLSLGNSRKPPAIPYNDIAFLRPADLKGEVHFKVAGFFPFTNKKIIQR